MLPARCTFGFSMSNRSTLILPLQYNHQKAISCRKAEENIRPNPPQGRRDGVAFVAFVLRGAGVKRTLDFTGLQDFSGLTMIYGAVMPL